MKQYIEAILSPIHFMPNLTALSSILFTICFLSCLIGVLKRRKKTVTESNNKKLYPAEEETMDIQNDELEMAYGLRKEERMFNFHLNHRRVQDLKTLDVSAKAVLIEEKILTVAELKENSLNFLLNLNQDSSQINEKLVILHECKRFLDSIDYNNGKSYLEY